MDERAARPTLARISLLAILLVSFALAVARLGYQELSGDEAFGYFFSLQSYRDIIRSTLALGEPHPVAGYFLQKAWLTAMGDGEFALRFTSAAWSLLAVALLYVLARRLALGRASALLAATLLGISPYAIWHAQNARMYAMGLALTLASSLLVIEAMSRRRWIIWAAYVVVSWLCLQTHYYTAFVILVQNIAVVAWVLLIRRRLRELAPWVAAQLALAFLSLPWLLAARSTLTGYGGNGDSPALWAMLERSLSVFAVGETLPSSLRVAAGYLAALLVVVGLARLLLSGRAGRRAAAVIATYLFVPLLATWVGALSRPIFNERYILNGLPAFCLLASAAVLGRGKKASAGALRLTGGVESRGLTLANGALSVLGAMTGAVVLVVSLISLGNYYAVPAYSKSRDWRQLAAGMARLAEGLPGAAVRLVQNFPDPSLWYYYRGPISHLVLPPSAFDAAGADTAAENLALSGVRRVIFLPQEVTWWDDSGSAEAALSSHFVSVAELPVGSRTIEVFAGPPNDLSLVDAAFENGVTLAAVGVDARRLVPGGLLVAHLRWTGDADTLAGTKKVTLQLLDSNGALVAQVDLPFGHSDVTAPVSSYGILLPQNLPAGAYRLVAALYDPTRIDNARLATSSGADTVDLGEVTVQ